MEKQPSTRKAIIWVLGGGKGGTGKTFMTSSLGIYLSTKRKKRVILIDGDLGSANLHSIFNIKQPKKSLNDFFESRLPLEQVKIETGIENLTLIAGDIHSLAADNIRYYQKLKLFRHIRKLDAQYVLIDLGGGSHYNIIDMFLFADKGIAVLTPESLAVENMYQFMKNSIYRKLRMTLRASGFLWMAQETWTDREAKKISNIRELIDFFIGLPETGPIIKDAFSNFKIYLILNKIRDMQDVHLGASIKSTFMKYLGIDVKYVGFLEFNDLIRHSTQNQRLFLIDHPESRMATEIEIFAENLLQGNDISLGED
jgi:flagellar biosynthesis protein FlhG